MSDTTKDEARPKGTEEGLEEMHDRDRTQPDPDSSSDGDASWTSDPITADPHEDRSVDAVIKRISGK
jgi:hypothetical protein